MRSVAIPFLLLGLVACGSKDAKVQKKAASPPAAEKDAGAPAASPASSMLGNPLAMMSLLGNLDEPGPYDEPKEVLLDGEDGHVALLSLTGSIAERSTMSLLGGVSGTPARDIQQKLSNLDADKDVQGFLLSFDGPSINMALAEELRASMLALKKPVQCHAENLDEVSYYLASACKSLVLSPNGMVSISGAAAIPMHIKGLLDRFGVQPDFVHVGSFKGAAEPLTRSAPSPEMKQTLNDILSERYRTLVAGIASRPGLDEDKAKKIIDTALFTPESAKAAGLIDEIRLLKPLLDVQNPGWKRYSFKDERAEGMGALMKFIGAQPTPRPKKDHVALVYAVGNVIDGKGEGLVGATGEIASRTLVPALRAIGDDEKVKAVVLRVDSPGGSAIASEAIWAEASRLAKKKPLIVSMGGVAASGGYYISAGAKKIFADPNTMTGSIGVVGGKLTYGKALARYGVTNHPQGLGKHALLWSAVTPWTAQERKAVLATMEAVYGTFKKRVASGRGIAEDKVEAVAQGRVWTGRMAKERGLVDELGGLREALAEARTLAKVDADVALEIYPPQPTLRDFLASFDGVSAPKGVFAELAQSIAAFEPALGNRLARLLRSLWQLRDARLMVVTFLPTALH